MAELPVVGKVGYFGCSSQCYGNCDQCRRLVQVVGEFEDLEMFRRTIKRW